MQIKYSSNIRNINSLIIIVWFIIPFNSISQIINNPSHYISNERSSFFDRTIESTTVSDSALFRYYHNEFANYSFLNKPEIGYPDTFEISANYVYINQTFITNGKGHKSIFRFFSGDDSTISIIFANNIRNRIPKKMKVVSHCQYRLIIDYREGSFYYTDEGPFVLGDVILVNDIKKQIVLYKQGIEGNGKPLLNAIDNFCTNVCDSFLHISTNASNIPTDSIAPVLYYFHYNGFISCIDIDTMLIDISNNLNIGLKSINITDSLIREYLSRYDIKLVPTIIVLDKDRKELCRIIGHKNYADYFSIIANSIRGINDAVNISDSSKYYCSPVFQKNTTPSLIKVICLGKINYISTSTGTAYQLKISLKNKSNSTITYRLTESFFDSLGNPWIISSGLSFGSSYSPSNSRYISFPNLDLFSQSFNEFSGETLNPQQLKQIDITISSSEISNLVFFKKGSFVFQIIGKARNGKNIYEIYSLPIEDTK